MAVKDHYTVRGEDIESGDEFLFIVKARVGYRREDGKLTYRLYKCPWPWNEEDTPQGSQIDMTKRVDEALFPTLSYVGVRD